MTDKKPSIADEMAKIRREREEAQDAPNGESVPTPHPADLADSLPSKEFRHISRTMLNGTPLDHAKTFAQVKKAQHKKKRLRDRLRFFSR